MNTIDRFETFKLNDAEHKLQFTVKAIIMCEKELDCKNLIQTFANMTAAPLSFSDAYTLFKWGLLGGKKYSEEAIEEIFMGYLEEYGMTAMQTMFIEAISKSGLLGTRKN